MTDYEKIMKSKVDIRNAIIEKGVDMSGISFPEYAKKILEIKGGSIENKQFKPKFSVHLQNPAGGGALGDKLYIFNSPIFQKINRNKFSIKFNITTLQ